MTHGRVALVTGSSRGLGAVIARRLAGDGFAVAINGRTGDDGVAAAARTIRDDGGTAEGFCADVTDEDQVAGLAAAITGALGPVDVLVLNATGPQPEAPVTEVGWADHVAQLDFFVKSPVLLGRLPGDRGGRPARDVAGAERTGYFSASTAGASSATMSTALPQPATADRQRAKMPRRA